MSLIRSGLEWDNEELASENEALKMRIEQQAARIAELEADLSFLMGAHEELQEDTGELLDEIQRLRDELAAAQSPLGRYIHRVSLQLHANQTADGPSDALTDEMDALWSQLSPEDISVVEQHWEGVTGEKVIQRLRDEAENWKKRFELQKGLQDLLDGAMSNAAEQMLAENQSLRDDNQRLRDELAAATGTLTAADLERLKLLPGWRWGGDYWSNNRYGVETGDEWWMLDSGEEGHCDGWLANLRAADAQVRQQMEARDA